MRKWTRNGHYGWVFSEAEEPVVYFTSDDVTTVDLSEILYSGTERIAIPGYIFRLIEMLIEETRPTLILIDDAWKVLDEEDFAKKTRRMVGNCAQDERRRADSDAGPKPDPGSVDGAVAQFDPVECRSQILGVALDSDWRWSGRPECVGADYDARLKFLERMIVKWNHYIT